MEPLCSPKSAIVEDGQLVGLEFVRNVMKDGRPTETLAIRVHVRRKLQAEALPPHDLFPERLGDYDVDVIEAEYGPQQEGERGE